MFHGVERQDIRKEKEKNSNGDGEFLTPDVQQQLIDKDFWNWK